MIARADFDDRESLVRLLERRAGADFARLGSVEPEDEGHNTRDDDVFYSGQDSDELADEMEATDHASETSDPRESNDSVAADDDNEDGVATDVDEWIPPSLSDVSDYEDDGAEAPSAPEYDPDVHYSWIDGELPNNESDDTATGKASKAELPSDPIERLQILVTAAKYDDETAVEQIRLCLDEHPEIWQRVGDLAAHAESLLIQIIAEGNQMVIDSMEREVVRLKAELADGEPSPLERLTVQRIVACWLHCQYADRATLAADAAGSRTATWAKRQESAERRYQQAIKTLDAVRRLRPRRSAKPSSPSLSSDPPSRNKPRDDQSCDCASSKSENHSKQPSHQQYEHGLNNRITEYLPNKAVPVS